MRGKIHRIVYVVRYTMHLHLVPIKQLIVDLIAII